MRYFFSKWDDFAKSLESKRDILLLFDFDGTLTPIVGNPSKVSLSPLVRRYLKRLSKNRRIEVGIISGRALKDIMRLVGVKGLYYVGNHGLEVKSPRKSFTHPSCKKYILTMREIASLLKRNVSGIKGAISEYKRLTLSLHYRLVPPKDIPKLKSIFRKTIAPYVKSGKVKVTEGKKVFEIRPPIIWNKGKAVKIIEKMSGRKNAFKMFLGDDITDEDAFKVLGERDYSIRVGGKFKSNAKYFLKNPNEVRRLLMKISKIVALIFVVFSIPVLLCLSDVSAESAKDALKGNVSLEVRDVGAKPAKVVKKVHSIKTEDRWEISIDRFRAESGRSPKAAVILCHGFNINNNFWDIDSRSSLARFLARGGYDVWAPSLRGSGQSSKPILSRMRGIVKFDVRDIPGMFIKAPFDIAKFGWTIDDHIHQDLPAIIDFVKEKSGFDKLYWIGHSMGGIVMYGYLETEGQEDIAGFIPISSMMLIEQPLTPHLKRIASQKPLLTASLLVNSTVASQARNFTLGTVKHPIEDMLFKRENMYTDVMYRFFRLCIDDTSAGVVTQFSDSIRKGSILSHDGKYNYTANMYRIKVPIMVMGGGADEFADETVLKKSFGRVTSRDKSIVVFSKEKGYSVDYGHCDLILGKNSKKEVYPVILSWLDKRAK
jgi:polyhydroxyalkanoate synthase